MRAARATLESPTFEGPRSRFMRVEEGADRARFVDTLMVTNATALYGIGKPPRSVEFSLRSEVPVRATADGATSLGPCTGQDLSLSSLCRTARRVCSRMHEAESSPEPHFCCPMLAYQEVDAVTCPSTTFRSDKGRLDATQTSLYPPRGDLFDIGMTCPVRVNYPSGSCNPGSSPQYAFLDDVDVVAAATPAFGIATQRTWAIPNDLAFGGYALMVEVSKEFDTNASFTMTNAPSLDYDTFGTAGNLGQPSVVYRVPFTIDASGIAGGGGTPNMFGFGDATGATGVITPPDATISSSPGSGEGRLTLTTGSDGPGRVHVSFVTCAPTNCATEGPPPNVPIIVATGTLAPTTALVSIEQVSDGDLGVSNAPVASYEIRAAPLARDGAIDIAPGQFVSWAAETSPSPAAPGTLSDILLTGLSPEKPLTESGSSRTAVAAAHLSPSHVSGRPPLLRPARACPGVSSRRPLSTPTWRPRWKRCGDCATSPSMQVLSLAWPQSFTIVPHLPPPASCATRTLPAPPCARRWRPVARLATALVRELE